MLWNAFQSCDLCLVWIKSKVGSKFYLEPSLTCKHFFQSWAAVVQVTCFSLSQRFMMSPCSCRERKTWEGRREREREVCTAFYTALICRESHGAIEAICSLPSTTHGQTKRSPTNCSACNPHPFPKPPLSLSHTHTNKQTCKCTRSQAKQPGQKGHRGTGPILVLSLPCSSPVSVSIQSGC